MVSESDCLIKGRAITENILLAQEIIEDIKKPNRGGNVVLKLDMTKAYDRVFWKFLGLTLRKLGFFDQWVDITHNYIANNWYSVIVNGGRHGFFTSSRGLRQGDPLSPSLFTLSVELLSQMLNKLQNSASFKGFYMNHNGPKINHLTFADDTILFCNGSKRSMELILKTLNTYEGVSGQLINKEKSCFGMADNTNIATINRLKFITGMEHQEFPIKYLGCPLISGRKKNAFYSGILNNIISRIRGWQTKFLSTGGRPVFLALPIHLLAAVNPPSGYKWEAPLGFLEKLRPLSQFGLSDTHLGNIKINEVFKDGERDWNCIQNLLPEEIKNHITNREITLDPNSDDKAIWTPSTTGKFTISSDWEFLRQKKNNNTMDGQIWQKDIPFKMSFLTWRAIHNKFSTNQRVSRFGITISQNSHCCATVNSMTEMESSDHLFCKGDLARKIWHHFAGPMGIAYRNINLKMMLLNWWNHKSHNPITNYITKIIPPIVCREI
ncbi:uncharacterized protein LOC132639670 [Lycium barbarum]|uniref:uncharacterized protein LOC132639670 n=1 Tax=Lycium barbarum TaxID=112863 RepID=UPI00293F3E3F|nr:uncharacterized protein LOC132639670 [Lycium barbarum]